MKIKHFLAALGLAIALSACGSDAANETTEQAAANNATPDSLPLTDSVEVVEDADVVSDVPTGLTPTTVAETAPTTTAPITTTSVAPTTAVPPTIPTPPQAGTCGTDRYTITLPDGWSHDDCVRFSEGRFPIEGEDFEFRPEIDVHFTTGETYHEALSRIVESETILSSERISVGTQRVEAVRLVIEEPFSEFFGDTGERVTYVVPTGDGVFFAAGVELVDTFSSPRLPQDERYAITISSLAEMMSTIDITTVAVPVANCVGGLVLDDSAEILNSGQADLDGDGDLESIRLVAFSNRTEVEISGLASVIGNITGVVNPSDFADPFRSLGWADWDGDGLPEIITREPAGPAAGDLHYAFGIVGCDLVGVGSLLSTGSTQYSDTFSCSRNASGTSESLVTVATRIDVNQDPVVVTYTTTEATYAAGVFITSEPAVRVETGFNVGDGQPSGLSSCATFFEVER